MEKYIIKTERLPSYWAKVAASWMKSEQMVLSEQEIGLKDSCRGIR